MERRDTSTSNSEKCLKNTKKEAEESPVVNDRGQLSKPRNLANCLLYKHNTGIGRVDKPRGGTSLQRGYQSLELGHEPS
jgi:hypothetical protein